MYVYDYVMDIILQPHLITKGYSIQSYWSKYWNKNNSYLILELYKMLIDTLLNKWISYNYNIWSCNIPNQNYFNLNSSNSLWETISLRVYFMRQHLNLTII